MSAWALRRVFAVAYVNYADPETLATFHDARLSDRTHLTKASMSFWKATAFFLCSPACSLSLLQCQQVRTQELFLLRLTVHQPRPSVPCNPPRLEAWRRWHQWGPSPRLRSVSAESIDMWQFALAMLKGRWESYSEHHNHTYPFRYWGEQLQVTRSRKKEQNLVLFRISISACSFTGFICANT